MHLLFPTLARMMPSTTALSTTVQQMAWTVMTAAAAQHCCGPELP